MTAIITAFIKILSITWKVARHRQSGAAHPCETPMILFHTTSIRCAIAIVRDGFRVSSNIIAEDRCANFHEGTLTSQTPNEGCTLEFNWNGGPAQDFTGRRVADMAPNVLYRQNGIWRLVLRPGTDNGLTFVQAVFSGDDVGLKKVYREARTEFARAVGRTIPVRYYP